MVQRLRENLVVHYGSVEALPNIRLLCIDTDPETLRLAGQCDPSAALAANEVLVAKLNRPSHYLRSREIKSQIDPWISQKMLYHIPRTPATTGLRLLGRLAFFDNYRQIAARLRGELEACLQSEKLTLGDRKTSLGIRTNRPRVYVLTGLAGGTGSGIFLDLAYVLRRTLRQLGYDRPDIVGLFLMPQVDRNPSQTRALGCCFASLTELNHFSAPGTRFTAHYVDKDKAINDPEPPFSRCILLSLPHGNDMAALKEVTTQAAEFLSRDLTTTLGRKADGCRAELPAPPRSSKTLVCQTFGLSHISWPRRILIRRVSGKLCEKLVQRWISKDASALRESVQSMVADYWQKNGLDGAFLMENLEKACEKGLGQPPDAVFSRVTDPLAQIDVQASGLSATPFREVIERLDQILGRPDAQVGSTAGVLEEPLNAAAEAIVSTWGGKMAAFVVDLVEQPEFRLAGAEEAVRQIIGILEKVLQQHESLCTELTARAAEAYSRFGPLLTSVLTAKGSARKGAPGATVGNLIELMRAYPLWRFQALMLRHVANTYLSLRGRLSDQLREINFCRDRLIGLARDFEDAGAKGSEEMEPDSGHALFPGSSRTLAEAVEQLGESLTVTDLKELDRRTQKILQDQFTGLVQVCLGSNNFLRTLEAALLREAEEFMGARLAATDVAEMYVAQHADEEQLCRDLTAVFEEAGPKLTGRRASQQTEVSIFVAPSTAAGERLRALAEEALSDTNLASIHGKDDIVFYREIPQLLLSELEQLGPLGYEAYRQLAGFEHLSPHSRCDITEWIAAAGGESAK
jgi:hypothetical protein